MQQSLLARYLAPEVLACLADQPLRPQGLVIGNLAGAHASPLSGFAVEFSGHREYVPGDDPKHIDWRIYFTRDKLFVKQYELETNMVCHLVVDASGSMKYGTGDQEKFFYAARMATAIGHSIVQRGDKVSLATCASRIREFLPPSNSPDQALRMAEHLDRATPHGEAQLAHSLNELAETTGRREVVFVLSDFLGDPDELESALQRLRFYKHEVVLLQIMHIDEVEFSFAGGVRLIDLEGGSRLGIQADELRDAYLQAWQGHQRSLQQMAQRNHCEHVLITTNQNMGRTLADYLTRRQRMANHR